MNDFEDDFTEHEDADETLDSHEEFIEEGSRERITAAGKGKLIAEVQDLEKERKEVLKRLEHAKEYGDLRENSEYQEARGRLYQIDFELGRMERFLRRCIVVQQIEKKDYVDFGAKVTLLNMDSHKEVIYEVVGDMEADIEANKISEKSLLVQSMINKKTNDKFSYNVGKIKKSYQIVRVEY